MMWTGAWRRPFAYGDPVAEVRAVHDSLGVIDVSTLGKIVVEGPGAVELLERLYPNRFADLAVGRVRYGVLTTDGGRIMDDGTVARLDEALFYVTTTSTGSDSVCEWFEWWNAVWGYDAEIVNLTGAFAAINLAGPGPARRSQQLTDDDVSSGSLSLPRREGDPVTGVPCLALRIGFVGELGYEFHCPASAAEQLWDASSPPARSHSGSSRNESSGSRRPTSSSGRTPTPSRTSSPLECRGSSRPRSPTSSASGQSSTRSRGSPRSARRIHDARRSAADGGGADRARRTDRRARHERPGERAARPRHRPRLGATRPGHRGDLDLGADQRRTRSRDSDARTVPRPEGRAPSLMTRLGFLSPDECSPGVTLASPLADVDLGGAVTELPQLRKLEIRGNIQAFEPAADETLLPLGPSRALVVTESPALAVRDRITGAGYRAYDMTAALTTLEFEGVDLLARLTELEPNMLPTTGSIARGTPALIEACGAGRFRLYVPRELARFVADVTLDLARGLGR